MLVQILFVNDSKNVDQLRYIWRHLVKSNNYKLIYVDVQNLYDNIQNHDKSIYKEFGNKKIISSFSGLSRYLSSFNRDSTIIISTGFPRKESLKRFKLYNELGLKWVKFQLSSYIGSRKNVFFLTIKNIISTKLYELKYGKLSPSFSISTGNYSNIIQSWFGLRKTWSLHTLDYERYLENPETNESRTLVYIDQNLFNHPDFKRFKISNDFDKSEYAAYLSTTLKSLSNCLNLDVQVALHPTSELIQYKEIFSDFEIHENKTIELIRNAKLVIGHYSTSFSYCVLFKKPIYVLLPPSGSKHIKKASITTMKNLNLKYCNEILDSKSSINNFFFYDHRKYREYVKDYLSIDEDQKNLGEKIERYLDSLFI
jgi:hypothetical protein